MTVHLESRFARGDFPVYFTWYDFVVQSPFESLSLTLSLGMTTSPTKPSLQIPWTWRSHLVSSMLQRCLFSELSVLIKPRVCHLPHAQLSLTRRVDKGLEDAAEFFSMAAGVYRHMQNFVPLEAIRWVSKRVLKWCTHVYFAALTLESICCSS